MPAGPVPGRRLSVRALSFFSSQTTKIRLPGPALPRSVGASPLVRERLGEGGFGGLGFFRLELELDEVGRGLAGVGGGAIAAFGGGHCLAHPLQREVAERIGFGE